MISLHYPILYLPTPYTLFAHYLYIIYTLPINYLHNNIFTLSTLYLQTSYTSTHCLLTIYRLSTPLSSHYLGIYSLSTHYLCSGLRLSFSLHDIRNPWAGNTNMINGFYQEPDTSHPPGEYRYLDAR